MQTTSKLDIWLQGYEGCINAKDKVKHRRIWTLFLPISQKQYRWHPTHSLDHVTYLVIEDRYTWSAMYKLFDILDLYKGDYTNRYNNGSCAREVQYKHSWIADLSPSKQIQLWQICTHTRCDVQTLRIDSGFIIIKLCPSRRETLARPMPSGCTPW